MSPVDDDQLSLPLAGADTGAASDGVMLAPELVVVRARGNLFSATPNAHRRVWTLHQLLDRIRLLGLSGAGPVMIDDDALMWSAARELSKRSPRAMRLARDRASLSVVLTHNDVDPARIATALSGADGRQQELGELFERVVGVRERMAGAGLIDGAEALRLGVLRLEAGEVPLSLRRFRHIELRHVVDPSELELRALLALARAGVVMRFVLPLDDLGRGLASSVSWIADRVESCYEAPHLELAFEPLGGEGALRAFVDAWYGPTVQNAALVADLPVRVEVARDPAAEARRIAGVTAAWLDTEGEPPRVAVAVRSIDEHTERIVDALGAYGVPVRRWDGKRLSRTTAGAVLQDLFELRRDGVPRDRLLTLLTREGFAFKQPPEQVARLARLLRLAVARTDVEDSTRPTGGYRHRLERLAAGADPHRSLVVEVEEALEVIDRVLDIVNTVPAEAPLEVYLQCVASLVANAVVTGAEGLEEIEDLLTHWRRGLSRVSGTGGGPVRAIQLSSFVRIAMRAFAETRMAPEAVAEDRAVELLTLPQLFGQRFDHVVIADCVHGRLPLAERSEPLLHDADKVLINQALKAQIMRITEADILEPGPVAPRQALELLWFAGGAAAAQRSLFITASGRDARGRERAPSEFLQEALLALGAHPEEASAGIEPEVAPHRAMAELAVGRAVMTGSIDDEAAATFGLNEAEIEHARAVHTMETERSHFFAHRDDEPLESLAATYAFAVAPDRVRRVFKARLGLSEERPLTPTRLEALATCRFRGYVEHLLKIDTSPESGQDADARALGTLAHEVLERFYQERKEQKVAQTRMNNDDRTRLEELVWECAVPMLEGQETGHLAALEANCRWLVTSLTRTATFLARQPPVPHVEPNRFELNIGVSRPGAEPMHRPAVPIELGETTLYFGGEIDRVDMGPRARVVVDYKNSTAHAVRYKAHPRALFNTHFQLPLYLRLLEHHAPSSPRVDLCGYLISLRDGEASGVLGQGADLRRRIMDDRADDGLAAGLGRVLLPVLDGVIPPDEGRPCRGCRVARVCRHPQGGQQAPVAAAVAISSDVDGESGEETVGKPNSEEVAS